MYHQFKQYYIWKWKEVPIYAPINVSSLQDFPLIETGKMEKNSNQQLLLTASITIPFPDSSTQLF